MSGEFVAWYNRWPERLEEEIESLRSSGTSFTIDEELQESGILSLQLTTANSHPAGSHTLNVVYPDQYPYFRPLVTGLNLSLARHQQPFTKDLCLLRESTLEWDPEWTISELLEKQLTELLSRATLSDPESLQEAGEIAEPITNYYETHPGSAILIDPSLKVPEELSRGRMEIHYKIDASRFFGVLTQLQSQQGKVPCESAELSRIADGNAELVRGNFPWIRAKNLPSGPGPDQVWEWLRTEHSTFYKYLKPKHKAGGLKFQVAAILTQDESRPGVEADAWIFLLFIREPSGRPGRHTIKAMNYSEEYLYSRAPELSFLRETVVAQAGLGCVGAPLALELVRAGIKTLSVVDPDIVDAGATVRWPFGLSAAGRRKVDVIAGFTKHNYPLTQIRPFSGKIGVPRYHPLSEAGQAVSEDFVPKWLEGADLILDTTAEWGVQYYLSELAQRRGIPFVLASGSLGGWGGRIFRIKLDNGGEACWRCLEHWRHESDECPFDEPAVAPDSEESWTQPRGCLHPTFTGAGFDLSEVALAGARFVVQTLSRSFGGGYPDVEWNYASLSSRNRDGTAVPPRWKSFLVPKHPECDCAH